MDLVQTVRKEGSRGGVNFSWDDVKSSAHRENYLGHSLMAPVGRWQAGKDLNWYARAEDAELTAEERAAKERDAKREEVRKIKEAEEDAMARAMGLPVPDRENANLLPLGRGGNEENKGENTSEVNRAIKNAMRDDEYELEETPAIKDLVGNGGEVEAGVATAYAIDAEVAAGIDTEIGDPIETKIENGRVHTRGENIATDHTIGIAQDLGQENKCGGGVTVESEEGVSIVATGMSIDMNDPAADMHRLDENVAEIVPVRRTLPPLEGERMTERRYFSTIRTQ